MSNSQNKYLCHKCGMEEGYLPMDSEIYNNFDISGTRYQCEKYIKHLTPPSRSGLVTTFITKNKEIKDYIIETMASGCVEIDNRGYNILYCAHPSGQTVGKKWIDGQFQGLVNSTKVVLPYDPKKMHGYPTGTSWTKNFCYKCKRPILI